MARTKITNASTGALALPPPYFTPLPAGGSVVVADDLATVNANLGATPGLWRTEVEPDSGGTTPVDGPLGSADIAAGAVTLADAAVFISTEQTGNGAAQSIAHGLGTTPSKVLVMITGAAATELATATAITEGVHTATNVVVTVKTGVKYRVLAWA